MTTMCESCSLNFKKLVPPKGPRNAKIYIAGMAPGREEVALGEPFCGPAGQLLKDALNDAGIKIDRDVRMFNAVNCRTTEFNNPNKNRDPTPKEIDHCKPLLHADIRKTNPQIILVMGKTAARAFGIDVDKYGSVREMTQDLSFSWEGIPLRVSIHPSHISMNGGRISNMYPHYVNFFRQFLGDISREHLTNLQSVQVLSPQEFLDWETEETDLGFDIETTTLDSINLDNRVCGLGFCDRKGRGTYTYLKDKNDFMVVHKKLANLIKTKKLYVFNFSFESTTLAALLQIHPYDWNVVDTRQTCLVVGKKGSLKTIASSLRFPNWENQVNEISDEIIVLYKYLVRGKKEPGELKALRESWDELKLYFEKKEKPKMISLVDRLIDLYNHKDAILTSEYAREILIDQATKKVQRIFYDIIPINIISEYCIFDSFAAIKIHQDLYKDMDDTEKKAVGYFKEHAELAAAMEISGVGWSLKQAKYLDKFYIDEMVIALKQLISNKLFSKALGLSDHDVIKVKSSTNLLELKKYFNPGSTHATTRAKFNSAMDTLFVRKLYTLYSLYLELSLSVDGQYVELKKAFTYLLKVSRDKEEMSKIREKKQEWINEITYEQILNLVNKYLKERERLEEENPIPVSRYQYRPANKVPRLDFEQMLKEFNLPKLDELAIIPLYDAFNNLAGVDIDDESTWTPEFEIIYYFRLYKKINKSYTSYLWGTVGMGKSTKMTKSLHQDLVCPPRVTVDWRALIDNNGQSNDYLPTVSWRFNVNGAETNRWRSSYHLWPWQCELQDLKIPRFPNGLLAHCDYSQMEVRTIAALAGETTLIDAYKKGKDVHRFMASKIFNRPEDQIEDTERRYSKLLTFSLIYGKTKDGIARDYFHGDLEKAKKLVDGFYDEFSQIDKYIRKQHSKINQGVQFVRSLLGEKIMLIGEKHGEESGLGQLKRLSVNYPIQSTASHLTALGINRVNREAFRRNLPIRAFGFTHDAGDFEFEASHIFDFLSLIQKYMQDDLIEEFGIPVKIDVEIGSTGNNMVEFKINSFDSNQLVSSFEGTQKALDGLEMRFSEAGIKYDVETTSSKEEYKSRHFLFMPKRAYSEDLGKSFSILKGNITVYNPKNH